MARPLRKSVAKPQQAEPAESSAPQHRIKRVAGPPAPRPKPSSMSKEVRDIFLKTPWGQRRLAGLQGQYSPAPAKPAGEPKASRLQLALQAIKAQFDAIAAKHSLDSAEAEAILAQLLADHRRSSAPLPKPTAKLPEQAPERWADRDKNVKENPAQFTRRVYGKWLGKGFQRRDLGNLDAELYRALSVWVYRHPDDIIPELPPISDVMDQMIERLSAELSLDELRKLGYAIDTRLRRANK